MSLPEDTLDLIALAFILVALPVAIVAGVKHLMSGFLPAARARVPRPGKLEKILSPVNALYPLWKSGGRYAVATRSWSKTKKERTEFVRAGAQPQDKWDVRALTEQGFLADTLIDLLQSGGPAADASRELGFRHLDETKAWFMKWSATDGSKPVDEDDEDDAPAERAEAERLSFVRAIDAREK